MNIISELSIMVKHRSTGSALLDHPDDYGHAFIRRNARVIPTRIGAADGMELADIVDIDHPDKRGATVRVARRSDPLLGILDITREGADRGMFEAAEQFRFDSAVADGIHTENLWMMVHHPAEGQTPAQMRLDAQKKVREAWLAVRGPENNVVVADVIRLVVLGCVTLQVVDMSRRCRHGRSREALDLGLERLADYYGTS
jgi:hypothetical protein